MRKSTSLKLGLNARKPVPGATAQAKGGGDGLGARSVFRGAPADEPGEGSTAPSKPAAPVFAGGSQAREAAKLASDIAAADPSAFAYDEVYDGLDSARSRAKRAQMPDDHKPRYMEKLIETAKQRKMQSEAARERLLVKEREREGDMYADKEVIVTAGYKEIKQQRAKLVAEDEAREASTPSSSGHGRGRQFGTASIGLYRELLDRVDREDAAVAAATASSSGPATGQPTSREAYQGSAGDSVDNAAALGSGLNVMSSTTRPQPGAASRLPHGVSAAPFGDNRPPSTQSGESQGRHTGSHGRRWGQSSNVSVEAEMGRRDHERSTEQERQYQALVKKYARRNDNAAVAAARQRYLERKQQQAC